MCDSQELVRFWYWSRSRYVRARVTLGRGLHSLNAFYELYIYVYSCCSIFYMTVIFHEVLFT